MKPPSRARNSGGSSARATARGRRSACDGRRQAAMMAGERPLCGPLIGGRRPAPRVRARQRRGQRLARVEAVLSAPKRSRGPPRPTERRCRAALDVGRAAERLPHAPPRTAGRSTKSCTRVEAAFDLDAFLSGVPRCARPKRRAPGAGQGAVDGGQKAAVAPVRPRPRTSSRLRPRRGIDLHRAVGPVRGRGGGQRRPLAGLG